MLYIKGLKFYHLPNIMVNYDNDSRKLCQEINEGCISCWHNSLLIELQEFIPPQTHNCFSPVMIFMIIILVKPPDGTEKKKEKRYMRGSEAQA